MVVVVVVVVLVVVVVDLYSASRSASNALIIPLRRKKMSFQRRFEAVGAPSRVPERVWKRVPFHQTRNGVSPTTKRAATVSVESSTGDGWQAIIIPFDVGVAVR